MKLGLVILASIFLFSVETQASIQWSLKRCPWGSQKKGGKPPGYFREWCEIENKKGDLVKHGLYKGWYETGEIEVVGRFWWGKPTDSWVFWHKNGRMKAEIPYKWGKKQGRARYFYSDGVLQAEFVFENSGLKDRAFVYHPNGKKRVEYEIVSWIAQNIKAWDSEGNQKLIGQFKNGLPDGEWKIWHSNGVLKTRGVMEGRRPLGEWPYFAHGGAKIDMCDFSKRSDVILQKEACQDIMTELDTWAVDFPQLRAPDE